MAHWIITDNYITKVYKCSKCGSEWHDNIYSPEGWKTCPHCKTAIEHDEKENEDTPVELGPIKDVVILSLEKYDEMKADLVKLGEDLEVANRDRERMLTLIKNIGLNEEFAKNVIPGTGKFIEEEISPITLNRKIYCCFEIER